MPLNDADIRRIYGRRIADARAERSQREIADELNALGIPTTPQAVSRWELGAASPRASIRLAVAQVLGVAHDDLFAIPDEAVA